MAQEGNHQPAGRGSCRKRDRGAPSHHPSLSSPPLFPEPGHLFSSTLTGEGGRRAGRPWTGERGGWRGERTGLASHRRGLRQHGALSLAPQVPLRADARLTPSESTLTACRMTQPAWPAVHVLSASQRERRNENSEVAGGSLVDPAGRQRTETRAQAGQAGTAPPRWLPGKFPHPPQGWGHTVHHLRAGSQFKQGTHPDTWDQAPFWTPHRPALWAAARRHLAARLQERAPVADGRG